eukprot:CAMPEP_0119369282 /NCGR_PEP_ID=MMETSP1334-20130426/15831_1 /TAXON_ID=127549 /ORGANISM="Calcidiscus leptoporus, Strain RCC1130" /LENGTH=306 /DNA_ID=CAMNT_0007386113 /DNA_START=182 /DNA_END=1102 /DNA_ORIENTATION=+
MEIVDTHIHLWDESKLPPWLASDPALSSIACTRSISDYAKDASGNALTLNGVYMEVDVAPSERAREAAEAVALCSQTECFLQAAVIGAPIVDGSFEEFAAYVREWATSPFVVGVRQVLHTQPTSVCLREDVVAKARLCGDLNLVFELCMRCDELKDAATLAKLAPKTRFVVDHCGGHHQLSSSTPVATREAWRAGICKLAECDNLWCKISGLLGAQGGTAGCLAGASWNANAQRETVRFVMENFREDRLIFGGDWPVCTLTAPLTAWTDCVAKLVEDRSEAFRARLWRDNAKEVYRLPEARGEPFQ